MRHASLPATSGAAARRQRRARARAGQLLPRARRNAAVPATHGCLFPGNPAPPRTNPHAPPRPQVPAVALGALLKNVRPQPQHAVSCPLPLVRAILLAQGPKTHPRTPFPASPPTPAGPELAPGAAGRHAPAAERAPQDSLGRARRALGGGGPKPPPPGVGRRSSNQRQAISAWPGA
ncbi:MAG: hypothetical protein J3K34DRAFT_413782 [Monoraphidium minutum]|nr:MAG: hypothetical protein J3K34DRAFT_413782 [Monoraphidium minutum]